MLQASPVDAASIVGFSYDTPVEITNLLSRLRADVMWASTASYTGAFLWPDNASRSQEFDALRARGGYFRLRARHSGLCLALDARERTYGNGTSVIQRGCNPNLRSSYWRVRLVGDPIRCHGNVCTASSGVYPTLQNVHTGKCLDARNPRGGRPRERAVLQQWSCIGDIGVWNAGNQLFIVTNVRRRLPITAVRVADDNGARRAHITPEEVARWVARANQVFAAANIQFDFSGNLVDLANTAINNIDTTSIPAVAREAAKYGAGPVVFFRWGSAVNPTGGAYSGFDLDFVMMPGFQDTGVCNHQNIGLLAHELGHYFGLAHTFASQFDNEQQATQYLREHGNNPAAFDGDGLSDTLPDPDIKSYLGNPNHHCGRSPSAVVLDGRAFELPRTNVMSYYDPDGTGPSAGQRLTPQQVQRVQATFARRFE
jgi:hypothetical protein